MDTSYCEMYDCGCDRTSKVLLVVNKDKTVEVMCEYCIERNKLGWEQDTLFFQIGDDVTNQFL
jgi:hypothetical protein